MTKQQIITIIMEMVERLPKINLALSLQKLKSINSQMIIIRPTDENIKSFLSDTVGLAKGIQESPFTTENRKELRTNRHRNIIGIEYENITSETMNNLLRVTKNGRWAVECYVPNAKQKVAGVIKGIHPSVDLDELPIIRTSEDINVVRMMRMPKFRGHVKSPSAAIKVKFEGKNLPSKIYLEFMSYDIHPYVAAPLRCYNCQRLGHTASGCNAKQCLPVVFW